MVSIHIASEEAMKHIDVAKIVAQKKVSIHIASEEAMKLHTCGAPALW